MQVGKRDGAPEPLRGKPAWRLNALQTAMSLAHRSLVLDLTKHDKQSYYWSRHPLAFLVEAADDICYAIIDIEDGFALGYLTFEEAKAVLKPIARDVKRRPDMENSEIIGKLRAVAIGELVDTASKAFLENEEALLAGTYSKELIADTPYKENIDEAKSIAKGHL